MKKLLSLFVFVPALLVCILPKESLEEGIYSGSTGCITTLVLTGVAANYLLHFSKVKNDGFAVVAWFSAIVLAGLSLATIF